MKNELSIIENNKFLNDAIDFVTLYPLSFSEFLRVNGEDDLCTLIEENSKKKIDQEYLLRIKQYLKTYMLIGGMPSVVKTYVETDSLSEAETEKSNIIFSYISYDNSRCLRLAVRRIYNGWSTQDFAKEV